MTRRRTVDCLAGDGEMARRMQEIDWSRTPLGPASKWSPALRHTVSLLLHNHFPLLLWWSPEFVQLYNDAYIPIPGAKHPKALGQPASECWPEIWHVIGPMIQGPFSGLPATTADDLELLVDRRGFLEETHFKVAYSPVPDDTVPTTGVGGVLATVAETTEQVFGQRQLRTLRELGADAVEARTAAAACERAAATFCDNPADIPFALFYLLNADGTNAELAATCNFTEAHGEANPASIDLGGDDARSPWPLASVIRSNEITVDTELRSRFTRLPAGKWVERPHTAILVPLSAPDQERPYGVFIAGCNPHRALDEGYRTFFELAGSQVLTAIRNARAYQEQRQRAEALAELDRAKTAFFSNVSHEFRTPLTLMLGPIEDLLDKGAELTTAGKVQLGVVHRNSLRLLKLVNTMLEFSRIEAGRIAATYEPVELAGYTAELASNFRSACERAGLELEIDCPPLPAAVRPYVDRDMWEKIVLNLVSNAFKFTMTGRIAVRLDTVDGAVRLTVQDTGVGIPPEELPHMFERFHRIRETRGRTHEGTGIGLALVQELAKLHGGTATVESVVGEGSTFTVTIPLGRAHLDPARVHAASPGGAVRAGAQAFVAEALRWLPGDAIATEETLKPALRDGDGDGASSGEATDIRPRVLWADDNADMREYVARLLGERFDVTTVSNGRSALEVARRDPPDVILTDVMMPQLDGFGLLREVRADPALHDIPVIMLSARAGEESRIEGMDAGADDYLVKPFTARELLARIDAHARMARVRRQAEGSRRASEAEAARANEELGRRVAELEHLNAELREARQAAFELMNDAIHAKDAVRLHRDQLETLANLSPVGFFLVDADFRLIQVNPVAMATLGHLAHDVIGRDYGELIRDVFQGPVAEQVALAFRHTLETGEPHITPEMEVYRIDLGRAEHYEWRVHRILLPDGRFGLACHFRDIGAEVAARREREELLEAAEQANKTKDEFLALLSHELRSPMNAIMGWLRVLKTAGTRDPKLVDRAVDTIERNVWTQAQIVNDLLDVSRIMSGKFQLEIERTDLSSVAMGAIESFRLSANGKGVLLTAEVEREGLEVMGDPARLQQVVGNLIGNALKFTDGGGLVAVTVKGNAADVELSVTDTGHGIDPAFVPHIFERFRQADSTSARKHGGLGLGLAIVKSVVEMHGGSVTAESAGLGQGARFTVRLPAAPARLALPLSRSIVTRTQNRIDALDVLVVEDDADTREALELALAEYGASVRSAASVQEAIDAYEMRPPDLVISDIGMPDEDGYTLIRAIRAREESNSHHTLAIAMTGFAGQQDRETALRAGFDDHVGKPIEPAVLFERVRVLDAARRSERAR